MLVKNRQTNEIIEVEMTHPTMPAEEFIGNHDGFWVDGCHEVGFRKPTKEEREADDRDYDYIATADEIEWWVGVLADYDRIESLLAEAQEVLPEDEYAELADEVSDICSDYDLEDWGRKAIPTLLEALGRTK